VIVDESRHDERATQIHDARALAGKLAHALIITDD
jgi:hypothetical protein